MNGSITKKLIWLTVFSIAMGYLETSVVVYLRALYFPEGFQFPMNPIDGPIAVTEFWREIATIVMLIGAGFLAGKRAVTRFAYFIYCFAIWDIFYYVFLKVLLDWPASLLTWDILFLVPVPWVGPVIAPVLVAVGLIVLALLIVKLDEKASPRIVTRLEWCGLISGAVTIIVSFCWEYGLFVTNQGPISDLFGVSQNSDLFDHAQGYVPQYFYWEIFAVGLLLCLVPMISMARRLHQTSSPQQQLIIT